MRASTANVLRSYWGAWQCARRLCCSPPTTDRLSRTPHGAQPGLQRARTHVPALNVPSTSVRGRSWSRWAWEGGTCGPPYTAVHVDCVGRPYHQRSSLHTSSVGSREESDKRKSVERGTVDMATGEKAVKFIGWLGGFYSRKAVLSRAAKKLYECSVDTVDYAVFFRVCGLPDSFQSWFLVAHLHVWLCMVRLKPEGKDGKFLTRQVVSTFWDDVQQRMKVLGVHSSKVARSSLQELVQEFYGLTLAYDEGLLSDDRTLAAAVWRNLVDDKTTTDPVQLARVVEYIRHQVQHMDRIASNRLMTTGNIELIPFHQPDT